MTLTMYDYIREQSVVLPTILEKRTEIGQQFLRIYNQKHVKKVMILASGSSFNEAICARYFMEKHLQKEIQVKHPYTFTHYETTFEPDTLIVAISQSGRSSAIIDAVKKAKESGFATAAVTADWNSALAQIVSQTILVPCGKEHVGYVTLGFTSTVLTLMLMSLEAARSNSLIADDAYQRTLTSLSTSLAAYDKHIDDADKWFEQNKDELLRAQRMVIIGYGPNYGTAMEGCLKVNETVRCPVSCFEVEEFMHGPYLELHKNSYVFFIAAKGAGEERIEKLRNFANTVTPYHYTVSYRGDGHDRRNIALAAADNEDISPLAYIIPFQVLAYRLSTEKGIDLARETFPDFNKYVHSRL